MATKKKTKKPSATKLSAEEARVAWDPHHYTSQGIQPIEYIMANNLGNCEANIVKYVTRWREKDGIKDLIKAKHYLEFLLKWVNGGYTREALAKEWLKLEQGEA